MNQRDTYGNFRWTFDGDESLPPPPLSTDRPPMNIVSARRVFFQLRSEPDRRDDHRAATALDDRPPRRQSTQNTNWSPQMVHRPRRAWPYFSIPDTRSKTKHAESQTHFQSFFCCVSGAAAAAALPCLSINLRRRVGQQTEPTSSSSASSSVSSAASPPTRRIFPLTHSVIFQRLIRPAVSPADFSCGSSASHALSPRLETQLFIIILKAHRSCCCCCSSPPPHLHMRFIMNLPAFQTRNELPNLGKPISLFFEPLFEPAAAAALDPKRNPNNPIPLPLALYFFFVPPSKYYRRLCHDVVKHNASSKKENQSSGDNISVDYAVRPVGKGR